MLHAQPPAGFTRRCNTLSFGRSEADCLSLNSWLESNKVTANEAFRQCVQTQVNDWFKDRADLDWATKFSEGVRMCSRQRTLPVSGTFNMDGWPNCYTQ